MALQATHRHAIADALQRSRVPLGTTGKLVQLIDKLLEDGPKMESNIDEFLAKLTPKAAEKAPEKKTA